MAGPPSGPFATPMFKPWINRWVGFVILLCFVCVARLTDVVYLASSRQMVGDTQLLSEDISMMGWSSFIGMTMIFPILFRLKFRFTTKGLLTFHTLALVALNLLFIHTRNVPLMVLEAFISGALRIAFMFECMSSAMAGITPKRDFAEFFPVVYLFVLGFIQITGFIDTHVTYAYNWQVMNYVDIGLLLTVCLLVQVLMRHFHMGKPMPLVGIDWLGAFLWAVFLGAVAYIFTYGEYLEWSGWYLGAGVITACVSLAVVLGRSLFIRHPYMEYATWNYPNVFNMLLLFFVLCFLVESQMVLQNAFTGGILHWDVLNSVRLNIPQLAGLATGAFFSRIMLARLGWTYKSLTFLGFLFVIFYCMVVYTLIDTSTNLEKFYAPVFFLGFGYIMVYVAVTVYAQRIIPFKHFFQGLCMLGMVRTGVANPISVAIYQRALKALTIQHTDLLGSQLNTTLPTQSMLYTLQQQATMASIKELYGYCVIIGIVALGLILASHYKPLLKRYAWPTDSEIYLKIQKFILKK